MTDVFDSLSAWAMTVSDSLRQAFAPTGTLRASINLGNPILAKRDPATGEPFGVSIDLARALAQQLGVGNELVVFDTASQSVRLPWLCWDGIGAPFMRITRSAASIARP